MLLWMCWGRRAFRVLELEPERSRIKSPCNPIELMPMTVCVSKGKSAVWFSHLRAIEASSCIYQATLFTTDKTL
jgi:hypothetical protein